MKRCPICKTKLNGSFSKCPICGTEFKFTNIEKISNEKSEKGFSKNDIELIESYYKHKRKNTKKALLIAAACLGGAGVVAGTTYGITKAVISSRENNQQEFNVKFVGVNGEELQVEKLKKGQDIIYKGSIPQKDVGDGKNYVFTGWSPELKAGDKAKEDITYTPKFEVVEMSKYLAATPSTTKPGCASVYWNQEFGYQPKYLVIPEIVTIDGARYTVDSIAYPDSSNGNSEFGGFENCESLISVELPKTIINVNANAFRGCVNLKTVKLHDYVETIEQSAFKDCESLTDINLPLGLTKIGQSAFENCYSLSSISIPKTVKTISPYAFYVGSRTTSGLKTVTFEGDTTGLTEYWSIGGETGSSEAYVANVETENAKKLKIYDGSKYIAAVQTWVRQHNPEYTARLKFTLNEDGTSYSVGSYSGSFATYSDVVIPAYYYNEAKGESLPVTEIESGAFPSSEITSVTLPETVTKVNFGAFEGCKKLTSINLDNVTYLGSKAFSDCTMLSSISSNENGNKLNDEIKEIPDDCFYRTALTTVELPENCKSIGKSAFDSCTKLEHVGGLTKDRLINNLERIDTYAFAGTKIGSNEEEIVIPSKVAKIGTSAFLNCINLSHVTLNEGLKVIAKNAFYYCTSLKSITFPSTIEAIYAGAFAGAGLTEVAYSEETKFSFESFNSSTLAREHDLDITSQKLLNPETYTLGSTYILKQIFREGVEGDNLYSDDQTLFIIGNGVVALNEGYSQSEEYLNIELPSCYITGNSPDPETEYPYEFKEIATFGSMINSTGETQNVVRRILYNISISPNIKTIGAFALYNCTNLSSITFPINVQKVYEFALGYYKSSFTGSLQYIRIPSSITYFESLGNFSDPSSGAYSNLLGVMFEDTESKWKATYDDDTEVITFNGTWEENLKTLIKYYDYSFKCVVKYDNTGDIQYADDVKGNTYAYTISKYANDGESFKLTIDYSQISEIHKPYLFLVSSSKILPKFFNFTSAIYDGTDITKKFKSASWGSSSTSKVYFLYCDALKTIIGKLPTGIFELEFTISSDIPDFYFTTQTF